MKEAISQPISLISSCTPAMSKNLCCVSALAVFDSRVDNLDLLLAGLHPGIRGVVLHPKEDGVAQLSALLSGYRGIEQFHLISHGQPGALLLGAGEVDAVALRGADWHESFAAGAEVLAYGCKAAAGTVGRALVAALTEVTGAVVRGSTAVVGAGAWPEWTKHGIEGATRSSYQGHFATTLVKNINPGGDSTPQELTALGNGKALFSANDGTNGRELWVTDGTAGGTTLVKDINPGSRNSSPFQLTALGDGKAVFRANDGTNGRELWVTDGTAGGTTLVKDINPGSRNSSPFQLTALGDGKAVFQANDGTNGRELWVTDGTTGGTTLVKDINPGGNSSPIGFTALGDGKAVFRANDGTNGRELWVTDGTAGGTTLVKDINPGSRNSSPIGFTALGNGKAVFRANDGTNGRELWVTDGTADGTMLVKDINPGSRNSSPQELTALGNGKAVFRANDGTNGRELWVTDGTAGGTMLVKDISLGGDSSPQGFTALGNGKAVFRADDGINGRELWVTDGTAGGTMLVKDISLGGDSSLFGFTALGNGKAVFRANDGTNGEELWVTDGIPSLPVELSLSANSGTEADATAIIVTATASEAVSGDQTVNLDVTGDGITAGDYTLSNTTITIPDGQTTGTVTFTIVDDDLYEGTTPEIAILTIGDPSGSLTLGTTTEQTIEITDNDTPPSVTLGPATSSFSENGGTTVFTATLSNPSVEDVTVNLAFGGTPVLGTDYTSATNIVISAGDTTGTVTLTGIDDSIASGDLDITIDIDSVSNGSEEGTQTVIATLEDDDVPGVTLTPDTVAIVEGGATGTYSIVLDTEPSDDVMVTLDLGSDPEFSADTTFLTFTAANWNTEQIVTLTAIDDTDVEGDDTATVTHTASSSDGNYDGVTIGNLSLDITDNDIGYRLTSSGDFTEGNSGIQTVTFTVTRAGDTSGTTTIDYAITGTATLDEDYENINIGGDAIAAAGTLTFADNETEKTITLEAFSDTDIETDETIILTLSNPSAIGGTNEVADALTLTIGDEDTPEPTPEPTPAPISDPTPDPTPDPETDSGTEITRPTNPPSQFSDSPDFKLEDSTPSDLGNLALNEVGVGTFSGSFSEIAEEVSQTVVTISSENGGINNRFQWGVTEAGSLEQLIQFDGGDSGTEVGQPFQLGQLFYQKEATSDDLDGNFEFRFNLNPNDVETLDSFDFLLNILNPANVTESPLTERDRLRFSSGGVTPQTFAFNGSTYTLVLDGFSTDGGETITLGFDSPEQGVDIADLYGSIVKLNQVTAEVFDPMFTEEANAILEAGGVLLSGDETTEGARAGSVVLKSETHLNVVWGMTASASIKFQGGNVFQVPEIIGVTELNTLNIGNQAVMSLNGDNNIVGTVDNNIIGGGDGADTLSGKSGNNLIAGGHGDDLIMGGDGNDILAGNVGNDTLMGGGGNNLLYGGQGDDLLIGGDGDDVLSGDMGSNTLIGGAGSNQFILRTETPLGLTGAEAADFIMDFKTGDGIGIAGSTLSAIELKVEDVNGDGVGDVVIHLDSGAYLGVVMGTSNVQAVENAMYEVPDADYLLGGHA